MLTLYEAQRNENVGYDIQSYIWANRGVAVTKGHLILKM